MSVFNEKKAALCRLGGKKEEIKGIYCAFELLFIAPITDKGASSSSAKHKKEEWDMIDFTTSIKADYNLQKEINMRAFVISLVMLILSAALMIVYIVVTNIKGTDAFWLVILVVAVIMFAVSLVNVILIRKINKTANEKSVELRYVFNEDYYVAEEYKNSENTATVKVYYSEVFKTRETKNYFVIYRSAQIAHPISKKDVDEKQLQALKNVILCNKARK